MPPHGCGLGLLLQVKCLVGVIEIVDAVVRVDLLLRRDACDYEPPDSPVEAVGDRNPATLSLSPAPSRALARSSKKSEYCA